MNIKIVCLLSSVFLYGCLCDIEPPKTINECIKSHTETRMDAVPRFAAPGMPSVGGIAVVYKTETVCDESITVDNPKYEEWLIKNGENKDRDN